MFPFYSDQLTQNNALPEREPVSSSEESEALKKLLGRFEQTALIITGPLTSIGKTGASILSSEADPVTFSCREYIEKWMAYEFGMVALITWEDEREQDLPESLSSVVRVSTSGVREGASFPSRNKYRQSLLVQTGAKIALENGFSTVLRVRSDQFFDPMILTSDDFKFADQGFIVTAPAIHRTTLSDFLFLAKSELLISWFTRHLETAELSLDVHEDLLRHLVAISKKPHFLHYPLLGAPINDLQREAALKAHQSVIRDSNRLLMDSLLWRGSQIDPAWDLVRANYHEPRMPQVRLFRRLLMGLTSLIWTDWFRFSKVGRPAYEHKSLRKLLSRILFAYGAVVSAVAKASVDLRTILRKGL